MPEHFSPSRSLKYCLMTLRTVEESSFSRASDFPSERCLGCKGHLFLVVFEPLRTPQELFEELLHGFELSRGGLDGIHAGPEHRGVAQPLGIPADVLARDAIAAFHPIESVQIVDVLHEDVADLRDFRWRQVRARREEMLDLAEDPG